LPLVETKSYVPHEKRNTWNVDMSPKNVICPECGDAIDIFTIVHVAKHGYTREQFLDKYPEYDSHGYWGTAWHTSKCRVSGCKAGVTSVRYWMCRHHAEQRLKKS